MRRLGADILRAAAVDLTGKALVWIGALVAAAIVLLVLEGGEVPAWALAAAILAAVLLGVGIALASRAALADATLEIAAAEGELARHTEYSSHLRNALDSLQRVVSGDIPAEMPYYVEQAVLAPARDILMAKPAEDVRLSVLWPSKDDPELWTMAWAAGHTMTGKLKYDKRISETLARHAFEGGQPQYWPNVETQTDFEQNPLASTPTRSMVSLPIRRGDEVLAVFNAVSAETDAFDEVERTFLASLAGVIAVAVSVWFEQAETEDERSSRLPG